MVHLDDVMVFCVGQMWKAAAGQSVSVSVDDGGDDWETDPDFEVTNTVHHFSRHAHSCINLLRPCDLI